MVCRALVESGHRVSTVSLLDLPGARAEAKRAFPSMRYFPCRGNRIEFVRRALRGLQKRPDVVLVGHPNFAPLGWVLGRLARVPVVNFIYGVDAWEPLSPVRRRALSVGNLIISISRFTAQGCVRVNGVSMERVQILYNCLDPHFKERKMAPTKSEQLSILTVARINLGEGYKGHNVVICALPELLKRFPDLVYDVVGDGDGRADLEQLASEQGVSGAVRFHGVVSDEKLIEHYQNASVFVMPSQREGFGFVFVEAMTYGKAVVCGDVDASVEVVSDGETGFTTDASSPQAVGEALGRLLGDRDLRERMGQAGKARVEELFGFAHFKTQLLEHLAEVCPSAKS